MGLAWPVITRLEYATVVITASLAIIAPSLLIAMCAVVIYYAAVL